MSSQPNFYKKNLDSFNKNFKIVEKKAEKRFYDREPMRVKIKKIIDSDGLMAVESKERVSNRLANLGIDYDLKIIEENKLERVIKSNDLLGINYLERGTKASQSVCRISVRDEIGRCLGYGSGFLISPNLLITNNHILSKKEMAEHSLADFNFENDINFTPKDIKTFCLDPNRFFYTNKPLDFTIVAVHWEAIDGTPLTDFGYLKLIRDSGKALIGECVSIIQHPDGEPKQITIRENEIVDVFEHYIHYITDTKTGSSGSAVFNDQWQVVALHHAGVEKKDANGKIMSIHDDKPWNPGTMTEKEIAWIANEGIRISEIYKDLEKKFENFSKHEQDFIKTALPDIAAEDCEITHREEIAPKIGNDNWYINNKGYDKTFLDQEVPLPKISGDLLNDVVSLRNGQGNELKYTHFSIIMSKSRRMAIFTAVNIDGNKSVNVKRNNDCWYFDPRIDSKYQCGPEIYKRNDLDRGHLVRRKAPIWGKNATNANRDTFHYTNCAPQHKNLNQLTWLNLENYILNNSIKYGLKVSVFTGPVFRIDDIPYRGIQIPTEFWKVVVMAKDKKNVSATAYLQTQKNMITEFEFAYGKYHTYQVPITRIESLTKLDFNLLRNFDPMQAIEGKIANLIKSPNDLRLTN